jgi:uncharacterized protein
MTSEEQNLIEGLFQRLRQADSPEKDAEAEQLIRAKTAELPSATYLLVQAVLVQEHALANAQTKIAELENRLRTITTQSNPGSGSFLSGISRFFGNKPQSESTPPPLPQQAPARQPAAQAPPPITVVPQAAPYPSTIGLGPSSGGSFLQTAMATAAGIAGGQLLFQGIESLIGHNAGPFGPALGSRGDFYPSGGGTEIINNYYDTEPSGHQQPDSIGLGSDSISQGLSDALSNTDSTQEAVSGQTDYVDAGTGAQDFDLASTDDSGFGSDDSFSGSDDGLV